MTYQPKHLPPSLDYEAWLKESKARPKEWNEDPGWNKVGSGFHVDIYGSRTGDDLIATAVTDENSNIDIDAALAGHDWESRSWFA